MQINNIYIIIDFIIKGHKHVLTSLLYYDPIGYGSIQDKKYKQQKTAI